MICAAGGVEIDEEPSIEDKSPYGSPSGLPVLEHGDLKMSQSIAVEAYLASIAPKFSDLTKQQQAVDQMYCCICEDVLAGFAKVIFNPDADAKPEVRRVFDCEFHVASSSELSYRSIVFVCAGERPYRQVVSCD
jgi:hypothetical protein